MKNIYFAIATLVLMLLGSPAEAHQRYHHAHVVHLAPIHVTHLRHHNSRWAHVGRRHFYAGNLPSPCGVAASLGGPCGCYASILFYGHSVRELWLAANWLAKPRTSPAPGTAAVWPGARHVAKVESVNGDGTITVNDSWNHAHRVSERGLRFVRA